MKKKITLMLVLLISSCTSEENQAFNSQRETPEIGNYGYDWFLSYYNTVKIQQDQIPNLQSQLTDASLNFQEVDMLNSNLTVSSIWCRNRSNEYNHQASVIDQSTFDMWQLPSRLPIEDCF